MPSWYFPKDLCGWFREGEMDFKLTEEQQMMKQAVREMMEEKVAPRAEEIDKKGEFPWDVARLFAENDILAIPIPEEYGGMGASLLTHCLVIEEIARVCASSSMILGTHALGSGPIVKWGTEEQKRKYLPKLASGDWLPAFALSEPAAGSDVTALETRAVPDGDHYVLNGTKVFCTQGNVAKVHVVFAKVHDGSDKPKATAFIVEGDWPGVITAKVEDKMGLKGSPTCMMIYDSVRVPKENVLGGIGNGFRVALSNLDKGRPSVAAQAVGIAQGALEVAVEYAKSRIQFGRPIIYHQAIQSLLAEMETEIQAARYLTYVAATKYDEGAPDVTKFSSMAKFYATEMVRRVTLNAVQVLGGYGFIRDYKVERMMRDAVVFAIFEGTNQIQRVVISRALTGLDLPMVLSRD
jgi:alkylation response protein AidB-like acyl-CoA dehydrogenase